MDSAEFDVIMHGVDDGVQEMTDKAANNMDGFARSTEQASEKTSEQGGVMERARASFEELNQGLEVGKKAYELVKQGIEATIGKFVEYADEVQKVSQISGQSTEESSRLIQVFEKYGSTVGDIEAATKKLTSQGLVPNKETIIGLAEKYQALTDPVEKNKLMFDNFGRSGEDLTKILNTNTEELKRSFDTVNNGLVLSDAQIAQADQLKIANEELSKSWEAISITLGSNLAPAANNWLTLANNMIARYSDMSTSTKAWSDDIARTNGASLIPGVSLLLAYSDAAKENTAKLALATEAEKQRAKVLQDTTDHTKAAAEAQKALSATLTTEISLAGSISTQTTNYSKALNDNLKQQGDMEAQIKTLISQGYSPLGKTVQDVQGKYDDLANKARELGTANTLAMDQMRISNLQAKLSVDGISDADYALIESEQVKAGIITQAAADQAVAMNTINTQLADHKITQQEYDKAVADGSLVVKDASDKNITAYDGQGKAVTQNADDSKAKIDELNTKTADAANVTTSSTGQMSGAWGTAANSVQSSIDYMIAAVQDYIDKVNSIPPLPAAAGGAAPKGGASTQGGGGSSTTMHVIDVRVNGVSQEMVTIL